MPNLLLDDGGLPKPQYESEDGTTFEPLKGRGGAIYVRSTDGSNETLGSQSDAEAASGNGSVIAIIKAIRTYISNVLTVVNNIWTKINSMPTTDDTVKVNIQNSSINTNATIQGTPTVTIEGTPTVTIEGTVGVDVTNASIATNATIVSALPAGSNLIGKVDNISTAAFNNNMIVGNITVGTTAVEVKVGASALADRRIVKIYNMDSTNKVYIGTSSGVTTLTGFPVKPDSEITFTIAAGSSVTLYAVAEGNVDVRVIEG